MSGTLPTSRAPMNVEVASWSPTFISRTHSMKTQRRRRGAGAQRWKLHFQYGVMERTDYLDLHAFLSSQRGQFGSFTAILPASISPLGTWGGTALANGAASAGASSVAIDGLTISITGIIKRGDFFKFSGHSKVYQADNDINSNGSGQATLTFFPPLLAAVADNEPLTSSSVPFTVILDGDEMALGLQPPTQGALEFSAVEDY
jgi:hypothetical protein